MGTPGILDSQRSPPGTQNSKRFIPLKGSMVIGIPVKHLVPGLMGRGGRLQTGGAITGISNGYVREGGPMPGVDILHEISSPEETFNISVVWRGHMDLLACRCIANWHLASPVSAERFSELVCWRGPGCATISAQPVVSLSSGSLNVELTISTAVRLMMRAR